MYIHRAVKNLSHQRHIFPAEVEKGKALPFSFSSHTAKKCPFVFSAMFSAFLCFFFGGDFAVYNSPKHSADMLCSARNCRKAVLCLLETISVFDKLH